MTAEKLITVEELDLIHQELDSVQKILFQPLKRELERNYSKERKKLPQAFDDFITKVESAVGAKYSEEEKQEALTQVLHSFDKGQIARQEKELKSLRQEVELQRQFFNMYLGAKKAYEDEPDSRKRASVFTREMGVSAKKKIAWGSIFGEYMELVHGGYCLRTFLKKETKSREDAIEYLTEKHDIQSVESCTKGLNRLITERRKDARQEGMSIDGLKGLVPGNKP